METTSSPSTAPQPDETLTHPKKSSWGWLVVWVGLIALLVLVAIGLRRTQEGPITIGSNVPDFSLTTFDGGVVSLDELRGKVVVINFWASWCKPCEQEAADLEAAWRLYETRGDVVFLGVDYVDTEPEALGYLAKFDITYHNGPDLGTRISQLFRITGVPETYFIDKEGKLAAVKISPFQNLQEITGIIDPLLEP
ncbi:MAG TPA: TlpA disulfide reductase family protein [Anaerolineales bacterium]|nr:TlpA disulfide reductase family protein [Anaerolineales bacterium]